MRVNRTNSHSNNTGAEHHSRILFDRIRRYAGKLSADSHHGDVHKFRTNSRRLEAILTEFSPGTRNKKKLLKLLSRLRKKAGKLRDIDVQIAFLKELKVPDRGDQRAQLLDRLSDERARRARKFAKLMDAGTVSELRKRLRRSRAELNLDGVDPLSVAYGRLPRPGHAPLGEKTLHACRVEAKRARYLAELSDAPAARLFVQELKRAQNVIGEWHDVLKLKELAEQRYGGVHDSVLVAVLQNISRARFRRAVTSLLAALSTLESQRPESEAQKQRKPVVSDVPARAAVA